MNIIDIMKKNAAIEAVKLVKDGMVVGLGTGSTASFAIRFLAEKDLDITCVATSKRSEELARSFGLNVVDPNAVDYVDITIDGADEVDMHGNLIKGYGGALTREKIIARMSKEEVIIVDETKVVEFLGQKGVLPVEILPFGWKHTIKLLRRYGDPVLRVVNSRPYITDNGNYIVDLRIKRIENPREFEVEINSLPGVVENGLFVDLATRIIIAYKDLTVRTLEVKRKSL